MADCMYKSFEEKYCWVVPYFIVRDSVLRLCEEYYGVTNSYTFDKSFKDAAYNNSFFIYGSGEKAIEVELRCPEGMEYDKETGNCYAAEKGKSILKLVLNKKTYKEAEDSFITGSITHICKGDCPGAYATLSIESSSSATFDIEYNGTTFLTKNNQKLGFKIKLKGYSYIIDYTKPQKVTVYLSDDNKQEFVFIPYTIEDVKIIPEKRKIRNDETTKVKVVVEGPKKGDYTYVLSSALDAGFYINGKLEPITAIVSSDSNEIEFVYKPPLISRVVHAKDFYIDELGQLSMEVIPSAIRGISGGLLGHGLGTKLNGVKVKGYVATYSGVNKALTGADSLLTWGMDGFVSASYSALALLGDAASSAVSIGEISYKTYQAYTRADERYKAFATTKEHDYNVPIKVDVKLKGNRELKKAINITVTAPEAIIK